MFQVNNRIEALFRHTETRHNKIQLQFPTGLFLSSYLYSTCQTQTYHLKKKRTVYKKKKAKSPWLDMIPLILRFSSSLSTINCCWWHHKYHLQAFYLTSVFIKSQHFDISLLKIHDIWFARVCKQPIIRIDWIAYALQSTGSWCVSFKRT